MYQNHNPKTTVIMTIIGIIVLIAVALTAIECKNFIVRVRASQSRQLRRFQRNNRRGGRRQDGDIDDILPDMLKLFEVM